jgi:pyruvate kinase
LEVVDKRDSYVVLKALSECRVENRKTMNIPGVTVDMPSLVEADYQQLDGASASELIDFVGLSFVRDRQDIKFLRQELNKRNIKAQIIAKIESKAALDNLREIVSESDGVMVARGDLGVEMPYEELTYWQKMIIDLCREKAKPVITATQMLKSMTENPRPTRAEVSDVAHAIYDGTDAIMLSEETTVGKYPVKAVAVQARIARFNEPYANCDLDLMVTQDSGEAMANMAVQLTEISGMKVDKIVNLTSSGRSTRFLARLHPNLPILAVTDSKNAFYELSLVYGVRPILVSKDEVADLNLVLARIKQDGLVQAGDKLVVTYGVPNKIGGTRTVTVIDV